MFNQWKSIARLAVLRCIKSQKFGTLMLLKDLHGSRISNISSNSAKASPRVNYLWHLSVKSYLLLISIAKGGMIWVTASNSDLTVILFDAGGIYVPSGWKLYARDRKTLRRTFVSRGKNGCFFDRREKNNFFRGKQMFFSEFFWPRHNVFSLKDTFSWGFILWPTINLYILMGSDFA